MRLRIVSGLLMCVLYTGIAVLPGCGAQNDSENSNMQNSKTTGIQISGPSKSASADSLWGPYYDDSGQVEVYYYLKSSYGQWNTVTATVPDDSVCIGGGAFCEFDGNPGFLTGSWPGNDLKSWNAQSKDHCYYGYHRLTVIAIGLRLKDINGNYIPVAEVQRHFAIRSLTSDADSVSASTFASLVGDYNLISGGAQVVDPFGNIGQLLTGLYFNEAVWEVSSKAHIYEDSKQITAYAVGCDRAEIANFGFLHISKKIITTPTQAFSQGSLTIAPTPGWVIVGVGGASWESGIQGINSGRLLTGLGVYNYPTGINAFVQDIDYLYPCPLILELFTFEIQKDRRAVVASGNYYIRNRLTGEYLYDGSRSDEKICVGSTIHSWYISTDTASRTSSIKNNATDKYMYCDGTMKSHCTYFEFWRYNSDKGIQNSTDPNGYFSIGSLEKFIHVENRLGYVETIDRVNLPSGWWSKDWYLEPAN